MSNVLLPLSVAGTAALIVYLSLVPGNAPAVRWMPAWLQNAGHVGCYAVLACLCFLTLAPLLNSGLAQGLLALFVATGFGALLEWLQRRVPGRHASPLDALRNALGALGGVAVAALLPW